MSSQLHQEAAAKARSIGISLNEFITRAISAAVL
jgi:predicted HicB family RNase H-like nuclease